VRAATLTTAPGETGVRVDHADGDECDRSAPAETGTLAFAVPRAGYGALL
jgi:hypothetical protein